MFVLVYRVPVPCARPVDVRVVCPRAGRVVPEWSPERSSSNSDGLRGACGMDAAAVLVKQGCGLCHVADASPGLLDGPSNGVNEYVDQVITGLRAHAGEHSLQASGGVGVGVADDLSSVGGES